MYRGQDTGELVARVQELEHELADERERGRAMELEVFAARKVVRRRLVLRGVMTAGWGALAGTLAGSGLAAVYGNPWTVLITTWVLAIIGGLFGVRWDPPEDQFPRAPPPRLGP